jgi:hypothetical protein
MGADRRRDRQGPRAGWRADAVRFEAVFRTGCREDTVQKFLDDEDAISVVRGLIELAGAHGTTYGYQGQWQLAVGMTNLLKVVVSTRADRG